jgi:hypothetical protein
MLVDYAEDYTDAATVVPALSTAYQVGKGMVRRVVPAEDGPETAETERADAAADAETPEIDREAGPAQEPLDAEAPQAEPGEPGPEATPVAAPASRRPRPRRRMTFSFNDGEQS